MICVHLRQNFYTIFGMLFGLCFGPILIPLFEEGCFFTDIIRVKSFENDNFMSDDFVPKINLAAKPLKPQKNPQQLLRPRYFTTELGIRKKLFVAVLTTQQTINSKGVVVNKTTSHLVDKLTFFIDAPGSQKLNVSYLKLPGIVGFIDTRVILKPFHVLKYIKDNYIENYDFFFIVSDNAYIKARNLNEIVSKISISERVYASTKIENSQYCSLNAGILFSNSVIQSMVKDIDWCVKNVLQSSSDDDNFGRCVLHSTNIRCQQMVQGNQFSSYFLRNEDDIHIDLLKSEEMRNALTIYPIRKVYTFYTLHAYFSSVDLQQTDKQIAFFRKSILEKSSFTPDGIDGVTWPVGNQPGSKPNDRFDILRWDYFTETHVYLSNDFNNLRRLNEAEREDIKIVINACVEMIQKKYSTVYRFSSLTNGYRKFDPSRGMDYILDIVFQHTTTNERIQKRIEVCKPLGKVEMLPVPYVTENRRVNILLPIRMNDRENAFKFLQQYKSECLEKKEKIFLMLVFIYEYNAPGKGTKDDVFKDLKDKALTLTKMYQRDDNRVAWLSIKLPFSDNQAITEALLSFAIVDLSLKKFTHDSLILLSSCNMEIRIEYLNRVIIIALLKDLKVRMNTIFGWQIFSPIPFSEYNPIIHGLKLPYVDVNKKHGHFDSYNTKHISFYAKDYFITRKRIEKLIPLVKSDSDIRLFKRRDSDGENFTHLVLNTIYGMFVKYGDVHVIRAVEPGVRLKYQEVDCTFFQSITDSTMAALRKNCLNERNTNLGSRSQLSKLLLEYQEQNKLNLTV
ncbi:hypothetical protein PGB90_000157 [Kerria lacca]